MTCRAASKQERDLDVTSGSASRCGYRAHRQIIGLKARGDGGRLNVPRAIQSKPYLRQVADGVGEFPVNDE